MSGPCLRVARTPRPIRIALLALSFAIPVCGALAAECRNAAVAVCFRPGPEPCVDDIVEAIDGARRRLSVQAYNFTAPPIVQAIGRAKQRGVEVRVVLDKENLRKRYTGATYLDNAGVAVRIDDKVAIAHNKVIIVDGELVIGGSYNFTASAESRNAENVTFIRDRCTAARFLRNFDARWQVSAPYARS